MVRISWEHDRRRLERARNYWLATTRPDGRPHVAPVWGVWLDGELHFGTSPDSVKSHNLAANPHASIHLDDSEDVLIVEGTAETETDRDVLDRAARAHAAKYVTIPDGEPYADPEGVRYRFTPDRALAWWELAMDETERRWSLPTEVA